MTAIAKASRRVMEHVLGDAFQARAFVLRMAPISVVATLRASIAIAVLP